MSENYVSEELIGDAAEWVEMPDEWYENRSDCSNEDCAGDRYHEHWVCTERVNGKRCDRSPAKPVVGRLTARDEQPAILAGNVWGGNALCLEHDSSVRWDSVQGRKIRKVPLEDWEENRLEEQHAEEVDEYVPDSVKWVRGEPTEQGTSDYSIDPDKVYQDSLSCNQCGRGPGRPVVFIDHFRDSDNSPAWPNSSSYAVCQRHDKSVTPAVARAYLRRIKDQSKRARKKKAKKQ